MYIFVRYTASLRKADRLRSLTKLHLLLRERPMLGGLLLVAEVDAVPLCLVKGLQLLLQLQQLLLVLVLQFVQGVLQAGTQLLLLLLQAVT